MNGNKIAPKQPTLNIDQSMTVTLGPTVSVSLPGTLADDDPK